MSACLEKKEYKATWKEEERKQANKIKERVQSKATAS